MSRPLPEEARRAEAVCMACRILRSNQVRLLPADPVSLAREMGFDLMPLRELSSLSREDSDALVRLTRGSDAFTFFFTRTLRVVIVYDDQVRSAERIRFSLFHEFGHILMNHFEFGDLTRMSDAQSRVLEREADIFARNLFCPPPVFDQIRGNPANPKWGALFCMSRSAWQTRVQTAEEDRRYVSRELAEELLAQFHDYLFGRRCADCGAVFTDETHTGRCPSCGRRFLIWNPEMESADRAAARRHVAGAAAEDLAPRLGEETDPDLTAYWKLLRRER